MQRRWPFKNCGSTAIVGVVVAVIAAVVVAAIAVAMGSWIGWMLCPGRKNKIESVVVWFVVAAVAVVVVVVVVVLVAVVVVAVAVVVVVVVVAPKIVSHRFL